MRGLMAVSLALSLLWFHNAQAQVIYDSGILVCWGENNGDCDWDRAPKYRNTWHAPCGFEGHDGGNPPAVINHLCHGPAGSNGQKGYVSKSFGSRPGGRCGYSLFEITCN